MNCCNEHGDCTQGDHCPARVQRVKPYPHVPDLPMIKTKPRRQAMGFASYLALSIILVSMACTVGLVIGYAVQVWR